MASLEKMRSAQELAHLKKNGVRNAINLLTSEWNDLDTHFESTHRYLDERFAELESREKRLLSLQQSVTESNNDLDSVRQSLDEKAKEIEHKHREFLAFQEEQINELKLKEEQLGSIRRSVNESIKEVKLREEKLAAHQRLIEGLFEKLDSEMKQFEDIQISSGERLEEINLKEKKLESREALLQLAQKCINDVLESSSGEKRKQQSEGDSRKKHKISGSCFEEQLEPMTGAEKMSMGRTATKGDFDRETSELRRSPRETQTTLRHLGDTNNERRNELTLPKENASLRLDDEKIYGTLYSSHKKVSEEVFHDFSRERSPRKIRQGQIWAVYDGGLPRKYAQIKHKQCEIDGCRLFIELLKPCILTQPLCCGIFGVQGEPKCYLPSSFSHVVKAKLVKNVFEIYPKKGEVWAIYKNWNADFSCSDIENCDYDIVEVLDDTGKSTEVSPLVRVSGFKSVFSPPGGQRSNRGRLVIPRVESGRFSHQIPAFQLTREKKGKLRGYWELDPAAVPDAGADDEASEENDEEDDKEGTEDEAAPTTNFENSEQSEDEPESPSEDEEHSSSNIAINSM